MAKHIPVSGSHNVSDTFRSVLGRETVQNLGVPELGGEGAPCPTPRDDRQPQWAGSGRHENLFSGTDVPSCSLALTFRPAIVHPQVLDGLNRAILPVVWRTPVQAPVQQRYRRR